MSCSEILGFVLSETLCRTSRRAKHDPVMFSRISDALQAAADVIAPPCPRVEDLRYHWTQLSIVCQRCQHYDGQPPPIEETHVPRHLSQMLKLLVAEEREQHIGGPLSPCMEYLVQEKVLATLASHARADRPLGIRQHVYIFLVGVLNHLHHSHLHHAPIHKPLQAMVRTICEMRASPYEAEEIEFLSTLSEKIRQDNGIILLYIQPIALTGGVSSGYTPEDSLPPTPSHVATGTSSSDSHSVVTSQKLQPKFPLVDALLNLCHSADSEISATAHDCLVGIASVREGQSSSTIARHTLLPHYLATRLVTASDSIPADTESALIEDVPLSERVRTEGGENSDSEDEEDVGEFPGKKEVVTFLHWLTFCDKLVGVSDGALGSSICSTIREVFLDGVLRGNLTSDDEDTISLYIAVTAKIITSVSSPLLVNSIISWLTEDSEDIEGSENSMRQQVMVLCQRPPHHLQIQALRLLQVLMEKPGSMAVQSLVLNYVVTRSYYDSSAAEHLQSSWSDEEDERYKHREGEMSPGSQPISRTLAPANINKIVKSFMTVVPEELRSTTKDDFESYMADAQRQYSDMCRSCSSFGWPREAVTPECPSDSSSTASRESRPEAEGNTFYEGPFLSMLMDFLEHLPDQDYDINLQVTSLMATLALLPHPHLHEYLLNPTIMVAGGVRTPFTVLSSVVSKIHQPIMEREDYLDHLKVTRYQLLGTMEDFDFDRDEDSHKFEALIVIEEFTKELASIAYAKYITEGSGW
ncbi:FHF complex subunit HOOK interacting protein 2A [Procambarus clarkii]|uniref:FHF complex subunit HOOK interacting protein 2A n=1 Tax=Procambarus clarkii TaxID=6728 RepID=UPI001E675C79|nr:FHF complex subunit HOOK interacting protein 2A-like isoform X2 [Procambarus clarkii]XP_045582330.1 FHF complex subunit HOOK interacting protein 2A-like isoform X2 [Procambarus clarkii]XP_045582331.1 FHF complex subunit HOOK interacting protein 2A-like isoform X2 [Procambarus clarkii]